MTDAARLIIFQVDVYYMGRFYIRTVTLHKIFPCIVTHVSNLKCLVVILCCNPNNIISPAMWLANCLVLYVAVLVICDFFVCMLGQQGLS